MINQFLPDTYTPEQKDFLRKLRNSIEPQSKFTLKEVNALFEGTNKFLGLAEYGHTNTFGHTLIYENPNTGDGTYIIFSVIDGLQRPGRLAEDVLFTCLTNNL